MLPLGPQTGHLPLPQLCVCTTCMLPGPVAPEDRRAMPTLVPTALQRLRPNEVPFLALSFVLETAPCRPTFLGCLPVWASPLQDSSRPSLTHHTSGPGPQAQVMARRGDGCTEDHCVLCVTAHKAVSQRESESKLQGCHSWLSPSYSRVRGRSPVPRH